MMIKKLFKILIQCTIANRLIFYDTLYNNTKDNQKIKGIFLRYSHDICCIKRPQFVHFEIKQPVFLAHLNRRFK